VKALQKELARLMRTTGLTPQNDKMPIDEGIKKELPDRKSGEPESASRSWVNKSWKKQKPGTQFARRPLGSIRVPINSN